MKNEKTLYLIDILYFVQDIKCLKNVLKQDLIIFYFKRKNKIRKFYQLKLFFLKIYL